MLEDVHSFQRLAGPPLGRRWKTLGKIDALGWPHAETIPLRNDASQAFGPSQTIPLRDDASQALRPSQTIPLRDDACQALGPSQTIALRDDTSQALGPSQAIPLRDTTGPCKLKMYRVGSAPEHQKTSDQVRCL